MKVKTKKKAEEKAKPGKAVDRALAQVPPGTPEPVAAACVSRVALNQSGGGFARYHLVDLDKDGKVVDVVGFDQRGTNLPVDPKRREQIEREVEADRAKRARDADSERVKQEATDRAREKAAPKEKAEKAPEAKAEKKKPAGPRRTVASACRELIAAGKTDAEIWAALKKEFDTPDDHIWYPHWYRQDAVRKGLVKADFAEKHQGERIDKKEKAGKGKKS